MQAHSAIVESQAVEPHVRDTGRQIRRQGNLLVGGAAGQGKHVVDEGYRESRGGRCGQCVGWYIGNIHFSVANRGIDVGLGLAVFKKYFAPGSRIRQVIYRAGR